MKKAKKKTMSEDLKLVRPRLDPDSPRGTQVTTPNAANLMSILGTAGDYNGVAFSHDEFKSLQKLYGFKNEPTGVRPEVPPKPIEPSRYSKEYDKYKEDLAAYNAALNWQDPRPYMQAGADLNMTRVAVSDGLRLVAWLARYLCPGDDPLKTLVQMATDAGWDVDPGDSEWAEEEVYNDA